MGSLDGWTYCPRCAAPIETGSGWARCGECGFEAWASSKPTASALCVDAEGRLLLARRARPPYAGRWDVPGGFLDEGEHPLAALRRELREETGLEVEPDEFLGIWMDWYRDDPSAQGASATLNLYWTARVLGGSPRPDDDVSELRWFRPEELPAKDEVAFVNVAEVIDLWRQQNS